MSIALIAAVATNGVIGEGNDLPWHIPEDLKRFKQLTDGHPVVMGRKTFESILARLGKPLPNRKNIVITRQTDYQAPAGVEIFNSIDDALEQFSDQDIFCIGGGQMYEAMINHADTLYITHVDKKIESGDTFFPTIGPEWKIMSEEQHDGFTYVNYKK